jgi:hypothetical protein
MNQEEIDYWAGVLPVEPTEIEYRLYYNDLGEIVACSMTEPYEDLPQYKIVTKEQYDKYFDYCVVNHQLEKINKKIANCVKLEKSVTGFCVVKNHASLVLEEQEIHMETEYYAYRNN